VDRAEADQIAAAQHGDEDAFEKLVTAAICTGSAGHGP
jgi:hypothetical protein